MSDDNVVQTIALETGELLRELTQKDAVGLLKDYVRARDIAVAAKADQDRIGKDLRSWLEANPDELSLRDGEHDPPIRAHLQHKRTASRYDVKAMPPDLLLDLQAAGALDADPKVLKALAGKATFVDKAKRFEHYGETTSLIVEVEKETP